MESIMQRKGSCYLCGSSGLDDMCGLEEHHVFGGPNRKWSEKYGLKVYLCGERCHRNGSRAAHKNKMTNMAIKAAGQKAFESIWGTREDFMKIFGRNYL